MSDIIATLIVIDADRAQVKAIVELLSARAIGMFDTALSADGLLPATHWVSSGHVDAKLVGLLNNPSLLSATCSYLGYPLSLEQATSLLSRVISDVNGTDAYSIFEAQGLSLCHS